MKIGIKIYGYAEGVEALIKKADFIEIMAAPQFNYDFLKEVNLPIVIHCAHETFGVNFADKTKEELNRKMLNYAIHLADVFNSDKIIVHPGRIENINCSEDNFLNFIDQFLDKRIIIENMPSFKREHYIFSNVEDIFENHRMLKKGLCLDLNHAIYSSIIAKMDYLSLIKEFVKIKPTHYHFGGQKISAPEKGHLALIESELDIKEIFALLPYDAEITLETSIYPAKTLQDIDIVRETIREINA